MRKKFPDIVERGRITSGALSSPSNVTWGMFFVRHSSGRRFKVMVGDEEWDHVSVSLEHRVPTWDEMCWIKHLFFEPSEWVVQYHPAAEKYVNQCGNCLHLWRPQKENLPTPPQIMV